MFYNYCRLSQFLNFYFQIKQRKMTQNVQNHILDKYKLIKKVGSGAYGHVWKVQQIKTNKILALKKIFDAFQHSTDAQRTYRQIVLLNQIENQNIVKLNRVIKAQNDKDLYLLFEFMQADLHNAIGQKILKDLHNRYIVYQLVKGIQYLHQANIIHRDLKPSNLLINSDCSLKVCDLGLARTIESRNSEEDQIFTQEVATRWYRAPEVLLGSQSYGTAADIWSIGCILAEMLIGKPLFPGNSTLNQLQKIVSFTGRPSKSDIDSIESPLAQSMLQSIGKITHKKVKQWFKPEIPEQAIDLVLKTVAFNPLKRLSADQILNHPYVKQFNKVKSNQSIRKIYMQVSENRKKSVKQYKRLIYEWIGKTYKDETQSGIIKDSFVKDNRIPLKDSINQQVKKSYSAKHSSSSLNKDMVKQTPTYSKKKLTQTPKYMSSGSSSNIKKLFRCNSQKTSKITSDQFLSSPLSTTYKQFKALKQSYFNNSKNMPVKKSPSLFSSIKQKHQKAYSSSMMMSKFVKPSNSQNGFGTGYSKQAKQQILGGRSYY